MVDLLDAAKNVLNGESPFAEKKAAPDNRVDAISQCKVIWYQWANELATDPNSVFGFQVPTPPQLLAEANSFDISNHIEAVTYTKAMGSAAGGFTITLHNSFDWPRYMKPGQWVAIFMTNEGNLPLPSESSVKPSFFPALPDFLKTILSSAPSPLLPPGPVAGQIAYYKDKLRCLGVIQRVAIRSSTNADGVVEPTYTITGKDYGCIYEDTELWFNANNFESTEFTSKITASHETLVRNLVELLRLYHDVFLNLPKVFPNLNTLQTFLPRQWVLPNKLVADFKLKIEGEPYFGNISDLMEFSPTIFEIPDPFPLSSMQGKVWDKMRNIISSEFHELFVELSDAGNPRIYFRPIPWAIDKTNYPTIGALILSYKDLISPDPVQPPAPINAIASTFSSLDSQALNAKVASIDTTDVRTIHSVYVSAAEVESYDVGQDYHSRHNMFLVDTMQGSRDQTNAFALLKKDKALRFPFREENDIARYGFKPLFVSVLSYNMTNKSFFGNSPNEEFMKQANYLIRDYHMNDEDLYTGSFVLGAGRNEVKLGKVLVTEDDLKGVGNIAFYIEGYTDTFSVNGDGVTSWVQSINVTRGMTLAALQQKESTKTKKLTSSGTFHLHDSETTAGPLGAIKDALKDPTSLL